MTPHTYLVFGDLHGRILPAFRLALAWQREHKERLAGLLQVGDLGYFPDPSRLDKATQRHAQKDPLELGAQLVAARSREADSVFAEPDLPGALWFTAGNHEDHALLDTLAHGAGCTREDFPVDFYQRVRCIRDGHVLALPSGLRVGALWGIDDQAPNARRKTPPRGRISQRSATRLSCETFDVLLTHDSPRDAMLVNAGSDAITAIVRSVRPSFAFFGHYHGKGRLDAYDFAPTQVFHLHGLEFRERGGCAEAASVGVLRWPEPGGRFEYVDPAWLRTFTRHNWRHR
jgi:hypothetical protein